MTSLWKKTLEEGNQHGSIKGHCRSKMFLLRGTNIYIVGLHILWENIYCGRTFIVGEHILWENIYCGITVLKGRAHHGGQYSKGSLIRHHCCFPLLTSSSSSLGKACVV